MPYVKQEVRNWLNDIELRDLGRACPSVGSLNYVITRIVRDYIHANARSYSTFNEVIGALECAKLELYRRQVVPYENEKIAENGDLP